jgi:hypothetical protein
MTNVMWETVAKSIGRVAARWEALAGAFATVIGILDQGGLLWGATPAWIWWAAVIVLLFVAAVRIDMELVQEQEKRPPEADMPLGQVVLRIAGQNKGTVFDALRERAVQGHLTVFGREGAVAGQFERFPLKKIPQDYWDGHHINPLKFYADSRGETEICAHGGRGPIYKDLYFDRRQIDARWPPPKGSWFRRKNAARAVSPDP